MQDPRALQDWRVASLIKNAMKVEKAMFETATSRDEYYQLMAEKIYRIRKELEERRRKVKEEVEKRMRMEGGWHLLIACTCTCMSQIKSSYNMIITNMKN